MNRLLDWVEHNHLRATLIILAVLVLLFSVAFCSLANAADATVSWTYPTKNTDGSSIPASGAGSIASTRVEYGSCSGTAFGTKAGEVAVQAPSASTTITGFAAGATSCFRAFAKNTFGVESAASGVASKAFPPPTPQPPVIVTVDVVVYEIKSHPIEGPKLGRAVGTVPLGIGCGAEPIVGVDYYEVGLDQVTLKKMPKSAVVVAECGLVGS